MQHANRAGVAELPLLKQAHRHSMSDRPLPGERYTSAAFADVEMERMWAKVWLLLGREDQIPEPGDYQVEPVGPESIIMVRQDDGTIRAFYNVCPHRGNRLVSHDWGSSDRFVCSYHAWRFDIDGKLASAPDRENFMSGDLCGKIGLAEIACETFAGFIWANMDPDCGSLRDFLGPVWDRWSAYPLANMKRYLALTARMSCNWKVVQDNFTESYHVQTVHPQAAWVVEDNYRHMTEIAFAQGHCYAQPRGGTVASRLRRTIDAPLAQNHELVESLQGILRDCGLDPQQFVGREAEIREALQQRKRKVGLEKGRDHYRQLSDEQLTDYCRYSIFPNISMTITADGIHFLRVRPHASDPAQSLFDNWFYAMEPEEPTAIIGTPGGPVRANEEVVHQVFDYGERSLGPVVEQDSGIMQAQQLGFMSKGYKGSYLANEERRLLHFHDVIDEYIAGVRPLPAAAGEQAQIILNQAV
ncbi:iron-sulfur protein [Sphingobium lactosutens]|uniref:aromatic ring-hydroxylating oxygenase subunit alpha n=1 Tax=Sphingobium lactosutens TaxID=522773 RepID=UPI0015BCA571|nr:aromatic ring-hydroxylating dioxygenase subunit alpha [Sphingobium lactosutens]NWK98313.1 iron-sulfur protein [Sphingobium lactosutens]